LEIVKTKIPKEKIPKQELLFGRTFSDHMLEIEWNKSMGWSKPLIKPYGPLQLYPSSSVFHYATEVSMSNTNNIIYISLFVDLLVFIVL
jgi:branched-chain amino acid aminotransferase